MTDYRKMPNKTPTKTNEENDEKRAWEEDEEDWEGEEEEGDMLGVVEGLFTSEDGVPVGQSLANVAKALENQNKILIKIITHLSNKQ